MDNLVSKVFCQPKITTENSVGVQVKRREDSTDKVFPGLINPNAEASGPNMEKTMNNGPPASKEATGKVRNTLANNRASPTGNTLQARSGESATQITNGNRNVITGVVAGMVGAQSSQNTTQASWAVSQTETVSSQTEAAVPNVERSQTTQNIKTSLSSLPPHRAVITSESLQVESLPIRSTTFTADLLIRDQQARMFSQTVERLQMVLDGRTSKSIRQQSATSHPADIARFSREKQEGVSQRNTPVVMEAAANLAENTSEKEGWLQLMVEENKPTIETSGKIVQPARGELVSPTTLPAGASATVHTSHQEGNVQNVSLGAEQSSVSSMVERVEQARVVMGMLGRQLVQRMSEGGGSVRLQLQPPELGRVHMEVSVHQACLQADAIVESAEARQLLMDNLPLLKQMLANQGVELERFDVSQETVGQSGSGDLSHNGEQTDFGPRQMNVSAIDIQQADQQNSWSTYRLRGLVGNLSIFA